MAFEIKQEGDQFVLYDDGLVFDKFATKEAAEKQQTELEIEEKVSDAVSDAIDDLLDDMREKFPTVSRDLIRQLIVENLS
jgi:hypothetical protein